MIDTNDETQLRSYNDKLKVLREQINQTGYTEDNLKVVISANTFPENRKVLPSAKESYVYKNPNCSLGIVVRDRIKKVDGINEYDDIKLESLKKQSEKYMPYNSKYNSTVYASINGLHNDYYATNYIIVDSFKEQVNSNNILSLRPEETLFLNEINLTGEAVILMRKDIFDTLSSVYPELNRMNVILYKGDSRKALNMYLATVGIIPENMNNDFVQDSPTSYRFNEFITSYANQKNIGLIKYEESEYYQNDKDKTDKLSDIYDREFYKFLLKEINVPEDHYEQLLNRLCEGDSYDPDNLIILDGIIDSIGSSGLTEIITKFNGKIDEMIREKKYPDNEKIINDGKIDLV